MGVFVIRYGYFFLKKRNHKFLQKNIQSLILAVAAPPLPPKPKKSDRPQRQPNASPPPPLPPRLPPRATPTRGVLESRSPHMDPVDPRREHNLMMQQMNSHSNPLPLGPRRHSNVVNGSGKSRNNFEKARNLSHCLFFASRSSVSAPTFKPKAGK